MKKKNLLALLIALLMATQNTSIMAVIPEDAPIPEDLQQKMTVQNTQSIVESEMEEISGPLEIADVVSETVTEIDTDTGVNFDDWLAEEEARRAEYLADKDREQRLREETKNAAMSETSEQVGYMAETLNAPLLATETWQRSGDYFYTILEDGTAKLTRYNGAGGEVVVPEAIDGYKVTSMALSTFNSNKTITSVVFPAGITEIPGSAFLYCDNLTTVVLPSTLTTIGASAFDSCEKLEQVTLPDTLITIGKGAFGSCDSLEQITLPSSIKVIGDSAFSYCEALTSLHIPAGVEEIGQRCFHSSGLKELTVDKNNKKYTVDSQGALYDKAKTVLMFYPPLSENTSYVMPDSVVEVADYVFYFCETLTEITLSDNLTTIGTSAFTWAENIHEIELPDSLVTIGDNAFHGCIGNTEWRIPENVSSIGQEAFGYCRETRRFTVDPDNDFYSSDADGVLFDKNKSVLIQYPLGSDCADYAVPDGVQTIMEYAFQYSDIKLITLPESLSVIEDYAFSGTGLLGIELPEGIRIIGKGAFQSCDDLSNVILPGGISSIGERAFDTNGYNGNTSLTWLYFRGTLPESIGAEFLPASYENSYYEQENVMVLYHPDCISWTGDTWMNTDGIEYAISPVRVTDADFEYTVGEDGVSASITAYNGSSLYVEIPEKLGENDEYTVTGIASLQTSSGGWGDEYNQARYIEIPDTVTSFGGLSQYGYFNPLNFSVFWKLTTIRLPQNLTTLENISLGGGMTYLELPDGITELPEGAFSSCSELQYLVLPEQLETIGEMAFENTDIAELSIPASVTAIDASAFRYMYRLENITVEEGNASYRAVDGILYNRNLTELIRYPSLKYGDYISGTGYVYSDFPDTLKVIGDYAFENVPICYHFVIPDGVTTIGDYAFYDCGNTETYTIPASVTSIGEGAFARNDRIEQFIVDEDNDAFSTDEFGVLFDKDKTRLIRYPFGRRDHTYNVPSTVETIGSYAFYYVIGYSSDGNYGHLKLITMQEGLRTVEKYAFGSELRVTSLQFPDSLETVESNAVCSNYLTSVYFGSGTVTLQSHAFSDSSSSNRTLKGIYFEGPPPVLEDVYSSLPTNTSDYTLYFVEGTEGWTTPTWKPSEYSYREYNTATFIPIETIGNTRYVITDRYGVAFGSGYPGSVAAGYKECTAGGLITGDPICLLKDDGRQYSYNNDRDTAEFMFDGDTSTFFDPFEGSEKSWAGLSTDRPYRLTEIRLHPREYDLNRTQGAAVQGSNDGTRWDTIWFSCTPAAGYDYIIVNEEDMLNKGSYRFFRYVSLCGQHGDIAELELYGKAEPAFEPNNPAYPEYTYTINEDGSSITLNRYMGTASVLDIPSTIDGYTVTAIGYAAITCCYTLETVTIPDTVTMLDTYAFSDCENMTKITIPDSVTSIGNYAFWSCDSLVDFEIPGSVQHIGDWAFAFCNSLPAFRVDTDSKYFCTDEYGILYDYAKKRLIQYPGGAERPDYDAVFIVPEGVEIIEGYAFADSGYNNFDLPDSLTTIKYRAFYYCFPTELIIPANVKRIETNFDSWGSLRRAIFLGDYPSEYFDSNAFDGNDFAIYYLPGKSGWTSPECNGFKCWPLTENEDYYITWDMSDLSLNTDETYSFGGRIESKNSNWLYIDKIQVTVRSAENMAVGIDWYYREFSKDSSMEFFDFSQIPPLTAGTVLSGIPISTSQEKLSFSEGTYYVTMTIDFPYGYDAQLEFTKKITIADGTATPVVQMQPVSNITGDSALLSAMVMDSKGGIIADWGFCLYDSEIAAEPYAVYSKKDGISYSFTDNSFETSVSGLESGKAIYVEAYASYYDGEIEVRGVSERISFRTQEIVFHIDTPVSGFITPGVIDISGYTSDMVYSGSAILYDNQIQRISSSSLHTTMEHTFQAQLDMSGCTPGRYYLSLEVVDPADYSVASSQLLVLDIAGDVELAVHPISAEKIMVSGAEVSASVGNVSGKQMLDYGFRFYADRSSSVPLYTLSAQKDGSAVTLDILAGTMSGRITGIPSHTTLYAEAYFVYADGTQEVRNVSGNREAFTTRAVEITLAYPSDNATISNNTLNISGTIKSYSQEVTAGKPKITLKGKARTSEKIVEAVVNGSRYSAAIDLSDMDPGSYSVIVSVESSDGYTSSTGSRTIIIPEKAEGVRLLNMTEDGVDITAGTSLSILKDWCVEVKAESTPDYANVKSIGWTTSDSSVATITDVYDEEQRLVPYTYQINARYEGDCTVTMTVTNYDGTTLVTEIQVHVFERTFFAVTDYMTMDYVENAVISIPALGKTYTTGTEATGNKGYVLTEDRLPHGTYQVTVTHPDYLIYTETIAISSGGNFKFALYTEDTTFHSVRMTASHFDDEDTKVHVTTHNNVNVLNTMCTLDYNDITVKFTLNIVSGKSDSILEYRLLQGVNVVATSTEPVFKNMSPQDMYVNTPLKLQAVFKDGSKSEKCPLQIELKRSERTVPKGVSNKNMDLGKDIKINFPEPFSGSELSLELFDIPIAFNYSETTISMAIGFEDDIFKAKSSGDTEGSDNMTTDKFDDLVTVLYTVCDDIKKGGKKGLSEAKTELGEFSKYLIKDSKEKNLFGKVKGKLEVCGTLKYDIEAHTGSCVLLLSVSGSGSQEYQIPISFPLVGSIGGHAKFTYQNSAVLDFDNISMENLISDLLSELESKITLTLSLGFNVGVGIGWAGVATATINGGVDAEGLLALPAMNYHFYVTPRLFFRAKLLAFQWNLNIAEKTFVITEGTIPVGADSISAFSLGNLPNETFTLADRSYLADTSDWYPENQDISLFSRTSSSDTGTDSTVLMSNIYPDTQLQSAQIRTDKVMVWLADDATRSSINRTKLVYSVYNEETEEWSVPQSVHDDGTLDSYPVLADDGENIMLAWVNLNKTLTDENTLDDAAVCMEICAAIYDSETKSFRQMKTFTANAQIDVNPSMAMQSGKAILAWSRNDSGDIWGLSGTNTICICEYADGTWSDVRECASMQNAVPDLRAGYLEGRPFTAYSTDGDNSLGTADDISLHLLDISKGTGIVLEEAGNIGSLQFVELDAAPALTWNSGGTIRFLEDADGNPEVVLEDAVYSGSYQIITENNRTILLSTQNVEKNSELCFREYDPADKTWSNNVRLTYLEDGYINDYTAFIREDKKIVAVFTSEEDEKAKMSYAVLAPKANLTVSHAFGFPNDAIPGAVTEVYLDVTNHGLKDIEKIRFSLKKEGITLSEVVVNVSLGGGESAALTVPVEVPANDNAEEYLIVAELLDCSESDYSDNTAAIVFGETDLSVGMEDFYGEDSRILEILIENESGYDSDATVTIRTNDADGVVIAEIPVGTIEAKSAKMVRYAVDDAPKTLFIEAASTRTDSYPHNNGVYYVIPESELSVLYGDVNASGEVDSADAKLLNRYFAGYNVSINDTVADVDTDGVLTRRDAMILARHIAGWEGYTLPYLGE